VFAARGGQVQFASEPDFFRDGGVNEFVQILAAEEREHGAGFVGVRADMAADKVVRVRKIYFSRIHPLKLKFAAEKSELDLCANRLVWLFCGHNRFGWQTKTATTNGVFCQKKL